MDHITVSVASDPWAALFAGVSALATCATAGIAIWALLNTKNDSKDRARPVVTMSFESNVRTGHMYLIVKNNGGSFARNLRITFSSDLDRGEPDSMNLGALICRMFVAEWPILAQGEEVRTVYAVSEPPPEDLVAPERFGAFVTYAGPSGRRRYGDTFTMDLSPLRSRIDIAQSDSDIEQRLKKIGEKIAENTAAITRSTSSKSGEKIPQSPLRKVFGALQNKAGTHT